MFFLSSAPTTTGHFDLCSLTTSIWLTCTVDNRRCPRARETTLDAAVKMTRQSVPTGSWPTLYVICVWNAITVKLDTVTRSLTVLRIKIQSTSADCQLEWQSVERIPRPVVKQLWRWWSDFEARYVKKISQDDVKTVVDVATYLRIS